MLYECRKKKCERWPTALHTGSYRDAEAGRKVPGNACLCLHAAFLWEVLCRGKASEKHHCFPVHAGDFHPWEAERVWGLVGWTTVQSEHDLHLYAYIAGGIQSLDVTGYRGVQSGAVQGCLYESGVAYQAGADGRADGATQEYGL